MTRSSDSLVYKVLLVKMKWNLLLYADVKFITGVFMIRLTLLTCSAVLSLFCLNSSTDQPTGIAMPDGLCFVDVTFFIFCLS